MGDPPTKEQLAELGVEVGEPVPEAAQPDRIAFEEVDSLPGEPKSDVKIRLESGEEFRERLIRVADSAGFNFSISNALLDADGHVAAAGDGTLKIVAAEACHEFRIEAVDMGRMTNEQVEDALKHAREVAAAKAQAFFSGMERGATLFGDRLNDPPPPAEPLP
jgi:hypothetical protein